MPAGNEPWVLNSRTVPWFDLVAVLGGGARCPGSSQGHRPSRLRPGVSRPCSEQCPSDAPCSPVTSVSSTSTFSVPVTCLQTTWHLEKSQSINTKAEHDSEQSFHEVLKPDCFLDGMLRVIHTFSRPSFLGCITTMNHSTPWSPRVRTFWNNTAPRQRKGGCLGFPCNLLLKTLILYR